MNLIFQYMYTLYNHENTFADAVGLFILTSSTVLTSVTTSESSNNTCC